MTRIGSSFCKTICYHFTLRLTRIIGKMIQEGKNAYMEGRRILYVFLVAKMGYWKVNSRLESDILGLLYKLENKSLWSYVPGTSSFLEAEEAFSWALEDWGKVPHSSALFFFCYCYGGFMVGSGGSYHWIAWHILLNPCPNSQAFG